MGMENMSGNFRKKRPKYEKSCCVVCNNCLHLTSWKKMLWPMLSRGRLIKNLHNTLAPGLIQAVRKNTARSHIALCGNVSTPVQVTDLVSVKRRDKSCSLHLNKNFFLGGWFFFVSDVIDGRLFGQLG